MKAKITTLAEEVFVFHALILKGFLYCCFTIPISLLNMCVPQTPFNNTYFV